ncbi:MAG: type III-B CRISPR module-associated protein Cmr3 [Hydrogenobaculum sp.]|nr:MAG: type III-B CRISPR module-associated protein Cmr3 [Hydrogenobaculum sp.]HEK25158.1 type III-B CRISPR module-associated protein Cmr3 [Hydrogenobaculum sp.]
MFYNIKPLDTLFFRDGRPFTMSSEMWTSIIFPPYPSTIYGAFRSFLIFERGGLDKFNNGDLKDELGMPEKKGSLHIKGPFISHKDTLYFPIPKDLVKVEEKLETLNLSDAKGLFMADYGLEKCLINRYDKKLEEAEGLISLNDLISYLKAENVTIGFEEIGNFYTKEQKVGIKRDRKTLASEEGFLYKTSTIRLNKNVNIYFESEGLKNYPDKGVFRLGGEGKLGFFEKSKDSLLKGLDSIEFSFESNMFKIYLATPSIFEKGWLPSWINEDTFEGAFNGIKLKLVCCSIGKYVLVGGWDMARNKPKPMQRAVPSGSVYYFRLLEETSPDSVKEAFHIKNISDVNREEGFGLAFVGGVKL